MRIGYKCAELGMSDSETYAVLLYLDDRIGKFKTRSDRKKRLLDIVNKARQRYPHGVDEPTFAGLLAVRDVSTDTQHIFGFNSFLASDFSVDWAINELMPQDGCGIIVSPGGIGKTQLMSQFAIHQCLGKSIIGYDFHEPLSAMMFSLEMGKPGYHRLSSIISKGYSPIELAHLDKTFMVAPLGEPMPLDRPEGKRFFEDAIETHQPKAIFLDSLQKVITGDIKDDESIRKFFNYIATVRNKYGVYVWIVHHTRKAQGDNKKPRELPDVYGSQYITSEPDTVVSLWQDPGDVQAPIEFRELKNRYAERKPEFKIRRGENLSFTRDVEGIVNAARLDASTPLGIVPGRETPPGESDPMGFR
jgi:hypothetical protein